VAERGEQAGAVLGAFEVHDDGRGGGVVGQIVEQVAFVDVKAVADGGGFADVQALFGQPVEEDIAEDAALGDDAQPPRLQAFGDHLGRGKAVGGIDHAHAVGPITRSLSCRARARQRSSRALPSGPVSA